VCDGHANRTSIGTHAVSKTTRSPRPRADIHIDAWSDGRRFTHDGTEDCLLDIARLAGVRPGGLVATHLPGPVVLRLGESGFEPDPMDFESARRGGHPEHTEATVAHFLDPEFRVLVESGNTLVADFMSPGVPDDIATRFRVQRSKSGGTACCTRFDDGQVMVILDIGPVDEANLRHEMIHAAQCLEDADAMQETMRSVAEEGRMLREAILASDPSKDDLRCLDWLAKACATAATRPAGSGEPFGSFEMALMLYPTNGIRKVAADFGISGKRSAAATLFTGAASENGLGIEPLSDMAREIVAYRFMYGLEEGFAPMLESIERHFGSLAQARP
jgi:hypothetical protein